MIKRLVDLLNNDEKSPLLQNQLKKDAQRIIAHYATDLEVYPGFWNRLKNFINNCFQFFGIKNVFDVQKTTFGFFDSEYQQEKAQLNLTLP